MFVHGKVSAVIALALLRYEMVLATNDITAHS